MSLWWKELFVPLGLSFLLASNFFVCAAQDEKIAGKQVVCDCSVQETTEQIMNRQDRFSGEEAAPCRAVQDFILRRRAMELYRKSLKDRKSLPQDEQAFFVHRFYDQKDKKSLGKNIEAFYLDDAQSRAIDSGNIATSFNAASLSDVGLFPPDSMGAVGPSQYIITINGLIRSFKKNGNPDGVLNLHTNTFFNSVRNGRFTSDPRIRYDRLSGRWFIIIITVSDFGSNDLLLAVSDNEKISGGTTWSFFKFPMKGDVFFDYCTLGIDEHALYIGGATFSKTNWSRVIVIKKSSVTSGGPAVATFFDHLIQPDGEGMYVPQGVDNFDDSPVYGYFIGVDNLRFGSLVMRRVMNPGSDTPSLSGIIRFSVPATTFPIRVEHKGNTGGSLGRLDGIDDRLMCAHVRNGRLWTVHQIGVNNTGVASNHVTRNAVRWYEIKNIDAGPSIQQAGTIFQPSLKNNQRYKSFWMPSIMTSGQGVTVVGFCLAGQKSYIKAALACRLATDDPGTMRNPIVFGKSRFAYNPPSNPGSIDFGRRWGDYSYTSVDPCDDMTFWTVQEYCNKTNSWGVRVAKLQAGGPAQITSLVPATVNSDLASVNVQINGQASNNSGFFDPGAEFDCRLDVSISGGVTVNSIEYVDPETININISTVGTPLGMKDITVTNPDGQSVTLVGALNVPMYS